MISFTLNGQPVALEVDPRLPTLDLLRDHLGIRSLKAGCAPQGLCGCCLVLINGQPRLSCTLPCKSLAGKELCTQEGIAEERRDLLAACFHACAATQCGYCTPGFLSSASALLASKPDPTEEELAKGLNLHLCRCTGYSSIFEAVQRAGAVLRGEQLLSLDPENDAPRGEKVFLDDLLRPGLLAGTLVLAPAARGRVRRLDLEEARAEAGVLAVVVLRPVGDRLEWPGEPVVAIAATDAAIAQKAATKVQVEVEAQPPSPPELRLRARRVEGEPRPLQWRASGQWSVPFSDPAYLEPEAALADAATLYSAADDALSTFVGRKLHIFQLPSGGSYGGRIAGPAEEAALRLSALTGKPVKVACSLEEGMRLHLRRPAVQVSLEGGLDAEGRLALLRGKVRIDGGSLARDADVLVAQVLGALPYAPACLELEVELWEGEGPRTGPVRGGAAVGLSFAVEQLLNDLARQSGCDGLALRRQAALPELLPLLEALEPAWALEGPQRALALGRMEGAGGATVKLRVSSASEVEVYCNVPDFGQGRDQRIREALVVATGLSPEVFVFPFGDSRELTGNAAWSATVGRAATAAGLALRARGGALAKMRGECFVGQDELPQAPGLAAALSVASAEGIIEKIYVAGGAKADALSRSLLEGAAHMGVGLALSEEVALLEGLPETRLRMLGVIKPRGCPRLVGVPVPLEGEREPTEAALLATVGAVGGLLELQQLPARDSVAGKGVGARPSR